MQQDILKDIEASQSAPVINQPRLFIVHTLAALFLAFFAEEVSMLILVSSWQFSFNNTVKSIYMEHGYLIHNLLVGCGLITAYTISYFFCRRHTIARLIPFGITMFALLVYYFLANTLKDYWPRILPGSYINVRVGFVAGSMANLLLFALIWIFLFFSKQARQFYK
jgi:hypothetical protein